MLITVRIPRQKSDFWLTVTLQIVGWRVFPSCFIGSSLNQTTLINQHPSGCWSVPMARWNALGSMVFPWTMPSSWCCSPLRETGTIQPGRIGILMPSSNGIWAANIGMTPKHSDDIWYINKMVMLTNANSNIWRVWQTMKYIYIYFFFLQFQGLHHLRRTRSTYPWKKKTGILWGSIRLWWLWTVNPIYPQQLTSGARSRQCLRFHGKLIPENFEDVPSGKLIVCYGESLVSLVNQI